MVFKTCEQYVLDRMLNAENEVEAQKKIIDELSKELDELKNNISEFLQLLGIEYVNDDEDTRIEFESAWLVFDSKRYPKVVESLYKLSYIDANTKEEWSLSLNDRRK